MKRTLVPLLSSLLLLLSACSAPTSNSQVNGSTAGGDNLSVVATTYPIYLLACDVVGDVEGVTVTPMVNQAVSCLHNYTLTVTDMKSLEGANLILLNGVGLEDFMSDALQSSKATTVDCSLKIDLLTNGDTGHAHGDESDILHGTADPHIWLDPTRACQMVNNIRDALITLDPDHKGQYAKNAESAWAALAAAQASISDYLQENLTCRELITFHDGFAYFADAFGLDLLMSIEEDEGSEASAQEIAKVVALIQEHKLPAIFTEVNGSDSSAQAIARETGVGVYSLSMIMSGPTQNVGVSTYIDALQTNAETLVEALG